MFDKESIKLVAYIALIWFVIWSVPVLNAIFTIGLMILVICVVVHDIYEKCFNRGDKND